MLGTKASPFSRPLPVAPARPIADRPRAPERPVRDPPEQRHDRPAAPGAASPVAFLFSAEGRISRFDYWFKFYLPYFVITLALTVADLSNGGGGDDLLFGSSLFGVGPLTQLFALATLWPSLAINIKRCHDLDRSGWHLLLALIPVVGILILTIQLGLQRGLPGTNRFGPDPAPGAALGATLSAD